MLYIRYRNPYWSEFKDLAVNEISYRYNKDDFAFTYIRPN